MDAVPFCSQSYVLRWAHIIGDHCKILFEEELAKTETELKYITAAFANVCKEDECQDDDSDRFTDVSSFVSWLLPFSFLISNF